MKAAMFTASSGVQGSLFNPGGGGGAGGGGGGGDGGRKGFMMQRTSGTGRDGGFLAAAAPPAASFDGYCDECGLSPIRGTRYHCSMCADYDLCGNW